MKNRIPFLMMLALLFAGFFTSCLKDECKTTRTFTRFDPIYKTVAEIHQPISGESPRAMKVPGKLYYINNYLLINEVKEGIHVFDNSNPSQPTPIAFWKIDGNVDMAIKGNTLYADQYTDLLTIDITDMRNPTFVCRTEGIFKLYGLDPVRGYIVGYEPTEVTETVNCYDNRFNQNWFGEGDVLFLFSADGLGGVKNNGVSPSSHIIAQATGVSGSYTRFCFMNDFFYAIDNTSLYPFEVSNTGCPTKLGDINAGWNIETIFPYRDRLFIGSQNGVFIFNATNPLSPVLETSFVHASGCDPVVCDGDYAYVTIHDGTECNGGTINQLEIIDISAMPSTILQKIYPMKKPFGLSVFNDLMFLCDDGLKIFDKTDVNDLKLVSHKKGIEAWDAIALSDKLLLVIGKNGFYQFDTTDPANPIEISHISVLKKTYYPNLYL
jgi:hypothetical protein